MAKENKTLIRPAAKHNYYIVQLSSDPIFNKSRVTAHHRYEYNRAINKLIQQYGKVAFVEYYGNTIPDNIYNFYLSQKKLSYNTGYNYSKDEYFAFYHVTHAYGLYFGSLLSYVALTCEQTNVPYLENHTYNNDLKKYSIGTIGLLMLFEKLGNKGFKELYFGSGDIFYKKRFCNSCTPVFNCVTYRSKIKNLKELTMYYFKKIHNIMHFTKKV